MERNTYCSTCKKDYVYTDFKQTSCPYCKDQKKEREHTGDTFFDKLGKILEIVPELAKQTKTLENFKSWLDSYITEQENLSSSFTYENKDNDIGNLYTFDSKLETLKEIRDKLNQIEEEVNRTWSLE